MNKNELSNKGFFYKRKDLLYQILEESIYKQYVLKKLKHHWYRSMEHIKGKREIL
jgi:hypothetical protein